MVDVVSFLIPTIMELVRTWYKCSFTEFPLAKCSQYDFIWLSVDDKLTIAQAHDLSNVATDANVHLQALLSKGNQLSIAHLNTQSMVSTFDEFRARMVEYP